jgi:hypothetical protein
LDGDPDHEEDLKTSVIDALLKIRSRKFLHSETFYAFLFWRSLSQFSMDDFNAFADLQPIIRTTNLPFGFYGQVVERSVLCRTHSTRKTKKAENIKNACLQQSLLTAQMSSTAIAK